ncbi:D-amino acid dehydrogenase [Cupriavidus metallidurans]|jgi:D-amino-acid dehydrogenase|uniref:D-amino acid dehydrogenase n=1 Tax=Cupriavidus metallidurans TaxID=119219 RepID=A0A2L0X386_9BURK|nr:MULTISPECIES: D-amino acid dehydrogenase [Cupriavidus]AVA34561.1 D-amino acid dehydrogenase [Cupriavidus metallidurans]KWR82581.1 D-amino acid dehydrogenase small subunit [Cupriavidus sp. SHE]QBP12390.1 D-amino acid dehydrogenase [Cupriavidus metallidurans]QWC92338.1 D-amino acid dehydrogenase [Cupriavidus metallidurans]
MRVCVLGGGVVGVASAYYLAREGHTVTLLEARDELAQETSLANGAQLSYSYVAPLADPAVLPKLPGWLLDRNSPLRFVPRLDWRQWTWCLEFLRACRTGVAKKVTAQLLGLGQLSRDGVHELVEREALHFNYQRNGKLVVYRDPVAFDGARRQLEYQASLGSRQQALDAAACVALEPALASLQHKLAGGIHTPSEEAGDCHAFTVGLAAAATRRFGASFRCGTRVTGLRHAGRRVVAAHTDAGDIEADAFVVAAGMQSVPMLAPLGVTLPLYPLTGYSLTAPTQPGHHHPPAISVTDLHYKVVYARLGEQLRIAGMVDLIGRHPRADARRVALLARQARETFPDGANFDAATSWCGGRPATPDSKPLIGATPYDNLWLNTGHGALGFTLACGSAALLADAMAGRPSSLDASAFALMR